MRSARARVLAVCVLVALITACSKTLDTAGLESTLKAQLSQNLQFHAASVTCPDGVKLEQGATFVCTAKDAQGNELTIHVKQADDQGKVTWTVERAQ